MKYININVKKIHEDAVLPEFAHATDTGFDLFTCEDLILEGKEKGIAKTGLVLELPLGWGIQVRNKSGMTVKGVPCYVNYPITKLGEDGLLRPADCWEEQGVDITVYLGTIDQPYRGEIGIMVKNESFDKIKIPKHTKLAQGVLEQVFQCNFVEVEEVSETDRGTNGYGSSGTKARIKQKRDTACLFDE